MHTKHQTPAGASEIAVSETVKQVNAEALDLLIRRRHLSRRILHLKKIMKGLRELATNNKLIGCDSGRTTESRAAERAKHGNDTIPSEHTVRLKESSRPVRSWALKVALVRACRIALLEAGGTASPDEIRRLIIRRGSFWFADAGSADREIIRTLGAMTDTGEVRPLEDNSRLLWERIAPEQETETSSRSYS
jgi:hypothetical protein